MSTLSWNISTNVFRDVFEQSQLYQKVRPSLTLIVTLIFIRDDIDLLQRKSYNFYTHLRQSVVYKNIRRRRNKCSNTLVNHFYSSCIQKSLLLNQPSINDDQQRRTTSNSQEWGIKIPREFQVPTGRSRKGRRRTVRNVRSAIILIAGLKLDALGNHR